MWDYLFRQRTAFSISHTADVAAEASQTHPALHRNSRNCVKLGNIGVEAVFAWEMFADAESSSQSAYPSGWIIVDRKPLKVYAFRTT
jgi:hypothetical protein